MAARDKTVDSLRGIACILLVTLHVAQNRWGEADYLEWYADTFLYIRMPLFAFLSGVVYAWRPLTDPALYGSYLGKKVRRLLVPYLIFVPLIGIAQYTVGFGDPIGLAPWNWLLYSLAPYWFLLATFWVYAAVALADSYGVLNRRTSVAAVFAALVAINVLVNLTAATSLLQFTSALYLGLFFIAGLASVRFGWVRAGRGWAWAMTGATVLLLAYTQLAVLDIWSISSHQRQDILGIVLGITFPLAFIGFGLKHDFLAWIGGYSYGIFLLHPFAILAAAGATRALGVEILPLNLALMSIAGIFGSILGVKALRTFGAGRAALGERTAPAPARVPA
ncbi:acyltransferase family protein [Demequina subtropica]|uniref:acyltransferase family protein n=1 Tax=Demequina subtropica TaxID=1638989 RepID=UPI000783F3A0|nr:acyltransferase [Demequina subtropica]